ncbi:hypothetical protein J6590_053898 [Homalodisca vitripennis]|nr:hypothetical protein J6590_053898 [Homalodisca vitripennis]
MATDAAKFAVSHAAAPSQGRPTADGGARQLAPGLARNRSLIGQYHNRISQIKLVREPSYTWPYDDADPVSHLQWMIRVDTAGILLDTYIPYNSAGITFVPALGCIQQGCKHLYTESSIYAEAVIGTSKPSTIDILIF